MTRTLLVVFLLGAFVALSGGQTSAAKPKVLLKTSKGDITIELDEARAPISVKNFLSYVDSKFYNGTIFHRVIKGFMIQGGGYTADFAEKSSKPPIKNEAANGLKNMRGTIAMARTNEINSATCQFFINHADNAFLDHVPNDLGHFGYAVFGRVISGLDVVDAIANSPTGTIHGMGDVPRQTIAIISIERIGS